MSIPDPRVQVMGYQLLWLPEDDPDAFVWSVTVEWRGGATWAVRWGGRCLNNSGAWDLEPVNSERSDEWKRTHRFDHPTAMRLALEAGPKLTIAGLIAKKVGKS